MKRMMVLTVKMTYDDFGDEQSKHFSSVQILLSIFCHMLHVNFHVFEMKYV